MTAPTSPGVVPADDVRELVERLAKQRKCQRCNCLSCGREGMGELHDHVCTGGPNCIETPEKLRNKNRNLRLLCGQAHDALRGMADRVNRPSLTEDEREQVRREHDRNIRVSECRLAVEFLHEFAREMNDPNAKAILNLAADNWGRARSRALACTEPRQEMEGQV